LLISPPGFGNISRQLYAPMLDQPLADDFNQQRLIVYWQGLHRFDDLLKARGGFFFCSYQFTSKMIAHNPGSQSWDQVFTFVFLSLC
jgi:hypothetical protein